MVQIYFVFVGIKLKCLGLHGIIVNNGTEDNIVVDKVLFQGLGWELYCCNHTFHIFVVNKLDCCKFQYSAPHYLGFVSKNNGLGL